MIRNLHKVLRFLPLITVLAWPLQPVVVQHDAVDSGPVGKEWRQVDLAGLQTLTHRDIRMG